MHDPCCGLLRRRARTVDLAQPGRTDGVAGDVVGLEQPIGTPEDTPPLTGDAREIEMWLRMISGGKRCP